MEVINFICVHVDITARKCCLSRARMFSASELLCQLNSPCSFKYDPELPLKSAISDLENESLINTNKTSNVCSMSAYPGIAKFQLSEKQQSS